MYAHRTQLGSVLIFIWCLLILPGHELHRQLVEPIRIIRPDLETTVQPQIHRSTNRAGPSVVYNRPQVPQGSSHTSLVPYQTLRCNPYLNTGVSNMVYHPGHCGPGEHMHIWCDGETGSLGWNVEFWWITGFVFLMRNTSYVPNWTLLHACFFSFSFLLVPADSHGSRFL